MGGGRIRRTPAGQGNGNGVAGKRALLTPAAFSYDPSELDGQLDLDSGGPDAWREAILAQVSHHDRRSVTS
jgi:hypothetical protein